MKRKILPLLLLSLIMAFAAGTVQAAEEQPIRVFMEDGAELKFEADPFLKDGSTLVPFRAIFEKLGLEVGWDGDTETVTGSTYNLDIQLQIGNVQASVNGEVKELPVAPVLEKELTFVPLRFVGEASGREVNWDGYDRTIHIAPLEKVLTRVLEKSAEYTNKENVEGYVSLIDETNPSVYQLGKQQVVQLFAGADVKVEVKAVELLQAEGDYAIVRATLDTRKLKGPEILKDNVTVTRQVMHKVNGSWKFGQAAIEKADYLNGDLYKDEKPAVKAEEEKAVKEAMDKLLADMGKEDFKAVRQAYDKDFPNLDMTIMALEQSASVLDVQYTLKGFAIVQGKDGEWTIRYTVASEVVKGPKVPGSTLEQAAVWKKDKDGAWKITKVDMITLENHLD